MSENSSGSPHLPPASIVVVSFNTSAHIESCLLSLLALDYPQVEIIVVDNASTDGSPDRIRARFPGVDLVEMPDNKGFAGAASVGLFMARGDIVATVNPDLTLDPGWLRAVAAILRESGDTGVVGSKILYPDRRTIQHAGGIVHYPLATTEHIGRGEEDTGQYDEADEMSFVTGAALAMWRQVGRRLRFFDDNYWPVFYEDVDLCWRARKEGLKVIYQPQALAYHEESVTLDHHSGRYFTYYHANRLRFVVKNYSPEQVMLDFLPAEAARVNGDMEVEDRKASLALLDNMPSEDAGKAPGALARGSLDTHLSEVIKGWRVREKPFKSSLPVVGGVVASLREKINNISTRWYVQPILQQQVDYNGSVARTLRELSTQVEELQARVRIESLLSAGMVSMQRGKAHDDLLAEIESLRARVAHLERRAAKSPDPHEIK